MTKATPKFLRHLYTILAVEDTAIVAWAPDGACFHLYDVPRMEREVLPKYFKHNKLASFQRQLNYFGFRKWTKTQAQVTTFSHPLFKRDSTPETLGARRRSPAQRPHAPPGDVGVVSAEIAIDSKDLTWLDDTDPLASPDGVDDLNLLDWDICISLLNDADAAELSQPELDGDTVLTASVAL